MNKSFAGAKLAGFAALLLGLVFAAQPSLAQMEDVIVTATKREQSVQDVPIAVSAFDGQLLIDSGIDDIRELQNLTASFQASSNVSATQGLVIRLRGVGTQSNNPAFESAVGVFIDGVYRSRPGAALSELLDIERVEVLRGPQGTLFGRNTTAGALNILTKRANLEEFEGFAEASYGNYDFFDIRGSASVPIVKGKFAAKIGALYQRRDGILDIIDNNVDRNKIGEVDDKDRHSIKAEFVIAPTDNVDIRILADYRKSTEDCCYSVNWMTRVGGAAGAINALFGAGSSIQPPRPFDREATINDTIIQEAEDWGLSAEVNIDFGNTQMILITSYRDFESYRELDVDFTSADLLFNTRDDGIETFTQELRLQGEWKQLKWIVGAFYIKEDITLRGSLTHGSQWEAFINAIGGGALAVGNLISGGAMGPLGGAGSFTDLAAMFGVAPGTGWADGTGAVDDFFTSDNESFSLFTHNTFDITERLQLIAGFRFTWDKKNGTADLNDDPANMPGCAAIRGAIDALPQSSFDSVLGNGDLRRVKDVVAVLGCPGITSFAFDFDLDQDDNEWSGILGLQFDINDRMMVYGHYSRGFKAGGLNLDRAGTILTLTGNDQDPRNFLAPNFLPELVDNFEIGMKSSLFGDRMRLNIALFWMDLDNFQLNTFTGVNFTPENVEDVTSYGFEIDLVAAPVEGLTINLGFAYSKTDYGQSNTDLTNILNNDRGLRNPGDLLPEESGLNGRQLTNAPRWVVTGAVTYRRPIGNAFEGFIHADFRWADEYNTGSDLDPEKLQDEFVVVNAKIGFGDVDGRWVVEFWARNLFDEDYIQVAFDIPYQSNDGFGAFLGDPRTYGGTVRVNF